MILGHETTANDTTDLLALLLVQIEHGGIAARPLVARNDGTQHCHCEVGTTDGAISLFKTRRRF